MCSRSPTLENKCVFPSPCRLLVIDGEQAYDLNTNDDLSSPNHPQCRLVDLESSKGNGLIWWGYHMEIGSDLMRDHPFITIPTGTHKARICLRCHTIAKKAFQRSDCSMYSFCSKECMYAYDMVIDTIMLFQEEQIDKATETDSIIGILTLIAIQKLFLIDQAYSQLQHILKLHHQVRESDEWTSNKIYGILTDTYSKQIEAFSSRYGLTISIDLVHRLYAILRFNMQTVSVPKLPSTYHCGIFPSVSRLNHSCDPNCIIVESTLSLDRDTNNQSDYNGLCYVVRSIRPVSHGEEMTISYIKPLALDVVSRRELLHQAFSFHCECSRCTSEELWKSDSYREKQDDSHHVMKTKSTKTNVSSDSEITQIVEGLEGFRRTYMNKIAEEKDTSLDFKSIFSIRELSLTITHSEILQGHIRDGVTSNMHVHMYLIHDICMFVFSQYHQQLPESQRKDAKEEVERIYMVSRTLYLILRHWQSFDIRMNQQYLDYVAQYCSMCFKLIGAQRIIQTLPPDSESNFSFKRLLQFGYEAAIDGLNVLCIVNPGSIMEEHLKKARDQLQVYINMLP